MGKLFFLGGTFFRLVTCNKAQASGRLQSLPAAASKSPPRLSDFFKGTLSLTSSSNEMSGPMSLVGLIDFLAEAFDWVLGYA